MTLQDKACRQVAPQVAQVARLVNSVACILVWTHVYIYMYAIARESLGGYSPRRAGALTRQERVIIVLIVIAYNRVLFDNSIDCFEYIFL